MDTKITEAIIRQFGNGGNIMLYNNAKEISKSSSSIPITDKFYRIVAVEEVTIDVEVKVTPV